MLSKRLRERIRLLPHESRRVRRGSLKEEAAGDLRPGGWLNLRHDIGDHAVRLRHPGQPQRRGVLKPQTVPKKRLRLWKFEILRKMIGLVRSGCSWGSDSDAPPGNYLHCAGAV